MSNITTTYPVPSTPNTRIHKDHSLDHVIGDVQSGVQTRRMIKTTNEQVFISVVYEGKTHEDLHSLLYALFPILMKEPKKVIQALKDPSWIEAMKEELLQFKLQQMKSIMIRNNKAVAQGSLALSTSRDLKNPEFPDRGNKATAKAKTMNGEVQIQALVDGKKVTVTETSVRRALQLKDAEVQAPEELGKGSEIPTNPQHTPTIIQPSTSQPQKKQPRRKQRKDTKVPQPSGSTKPIIDEAANEEHVPTHSNDPLLSEVTLVDETQGRNDDYLMFDTRVFDEQEVEIEKAVSTAEVTTVSAITTIVDELTLAQTLIEIKEAKPKAVTTAATTTTTVVARPKAREVVVQEPKNQILIDEEIAQKLQAQLNAELEEEEKLAKQREEDTNIAEWDNVQAMIDAYYELAARLQAQEQEELIVEEKSKIFVELMDKRKKHFARLGAEEQRKKPPTKAQKRN
ncbi:hypothetical protein Tco_0694609 [Tanacetum coccineum]